MKCQSIVAAIAATICVALFRQTNAELSFELQKEEFAKYHRQITGRDAIDGEVRFAIDPKVSKSGKDAYSIASGSGRAGRPRPADTARPEAAPYHDDSPAARAHELAALFNLLADVLALHTDYSLWESYQRLDAIEKIQNPDFAKTLFENAVNQYCLSHQYEAIRYVVEPIAALVAKRISKAVEADDRNARFPVRPEMEEMRRLAKSKPLESLKPTLPRTEENFRKIMHDAEKLLKVASERFERLSI